MQFRWTPYQDLHIAQITPDFVFRDSPLWPSVTALICFTTIEFQQSDRVIRQFGGQQPIPIEPLNLDRVHGKDARGADYWWPDQYRAYHDFWDARTGQVVQFQASSDDRPSAEYMRWYSNVARRFLCSDRVLRDPRRAEMPQDVPEHVPPVPSVAIPAHAPDRRRRERRLRVGTRASRRRDDDDDDDDDDDYADPCQFGDDDDQPHRHSHSSAGDPSWQPMPEYGTSSQGCTMATTSQTIGEPSSQMMGGPSQQYMTGSSSQFHSSPGQQYSPGVGAICAELEAFLNAPIPASTPIGDETVPPDVYRPSLDGIDLNVNPSTPVPSYQRLYDFDLFGETPPSAFTVGQIDHEAQQDQHRESEQDQEQQRDHELESPQDQEQDQDQDEDHDHGRGRPTREIRPRQCHTGCRLPAPRQDRRE